MTTTMVGPYRLEHLIGRGGMGEVHRAADTRKNDRLVAVKLMSREITDPEFEERFRREADAAARLRNPHVIPIHDYGEVDGRLFLEMALVEGVDLAAELRRRGPLPPTRAVRLVGQIGSALDTAHRNQLVHRDVKPSNILLLDQHDGPDDEVYAYLVDFGIAQSMAATSVTATGTALGTAPYMAPERFTHPATSDHRVDVYALGCVLHEALTGSAPFPGHDFPSLMYAHLSSPAPQPSRLRAGIPGELDIVISRALAKSPAERYSSAGELAAAARQALTRHVAAPTMAPWTPGPVPPSGPAGPSTPRPKITPRATPGSPPMTRVLATSPRDTRWQCLDGHGTLVRWLVPRGAPVSPGTRLAEATCHGRRVYLCSAAAGDVHRHLAMPGEAFGPERDLIELDHTRVASSNTPGAWLAILGILVGLVVLIGILVSIFG
ncbi:protein kinase domain-containing protein [Actinomycetospora sp. CA-101289]|uniref:protein kinase domain-containing protein n=1 Tax=Actinomycetospora sp. CA-101289 TaxID=3239893 RepID=UPI003D97DDB1